MKAGIIGLPSSGKTTVFNAISGGTAEVHAFAGSGQAAPNLAVVAVPDTRQDWLTQLYKPKKTAPATLELVDVSGVMPGQAKKDGFAGDMLANLRQVDALVDVVRAFKDESLPHPAGSVDPDRDAQSLAEELIIADLIVVEKRLSKIDSDIQRKKGPEQTALQDEKDLLERFQKSLSNEKPLREEAISEDEHKIIRGYTFLSMKPLLVISNIEEAAIAESEKAARNNGSSPHKKPLPIQFCAKAEMDIAQMAAGEQDEFLKMLGIQEPARAKLIKAIYALLDLIAFFTVGEDEVKAWTISRGTPAQEAARKIHSDIARGFIRAEVVSFEVLKEHGSWNAAKDKGLVRLEGKEYVVQDGDCINFRFNV
jgi:GTP-binding protein YchF